MADNVASQAPVVILDEFLVAEELRALLDFTLYHTGEFTATQVITANGEALLDAQYRRSRVLFDLGPFHQVFGERLMTFLPHVLTRLGEPWFSVSQIEIQLTGTNHNDYFRVHTDNDQHQVANRALTLVYFFHREPCAFTGGELRIFDTQRENGHARALGPYRLIYPLQNQIVFFPSGLLHEILPVACGSGDFADSRFTVNGWLHR